MALGARDYDPQTGRWTSKGSDCIQGDGPNLYAYVLGDSVNKLDHSGEGIVDCVKAAAKYKRLLDKLAERMQERMTRLLRARIADMTRAMRGVDACRRRSKAKGSSPLQRPKDTGRTRFARSRRHLCSPCNC